MSQVNVRPGLDATLERLVRLTAPRTQHTLAGASQYKDITLFVRNSIVLLTRKLLSNKT